MREGGRLSCISGFLLGVNVPDDVVLEPVDAIAGALGHLGEAFGLGLVFECVTGEIDAYEARPMSAISFKTRACFLREFFRCDGRTRNLRSGVRLNVAKESGS